MTNGWYYVYVVELDDEAPLPEKDNPSLPYLYVGVSHNPPEKRYSIHKEGGKTASKIVLNHGIQLRPDLYEHLKAVRKRDAADYEQQVAEDLRDAGYVVDSGGYGFFRDRYY